MLGFLYDLGCTLSLFVLVVFMEGVIATRKNAKWTGLILPVVLLIISVFVGAPRRGGRSGAGSPSLQRLLHPAHVQPRPGIAEIRL